MHELSVALSIVKIAEGEAHKVHAKAIELIELEIGNLAGIEFESLDFVWQIAVQGSLLENAVKKIIRIPGKAKCGDCDTVFKIENIYDSCPNCNSYLKGIIEGKELRVKTIKVA